MPTSLGDVLELLLLTIAVALAMPLARYLAERIAPQPYKYKTINKKARIPWQP
jgi:hypothetical protein